MSVNQILLTEKPGIEDLKRCAIQFADDLLGRSFGTAKIMKKVLTLLEIFKYQINKFKRMGYCDHELSFFCYISAQRLIASFQGLSESKLAPLIGSVHETFEALRPRFSEIKKCPEFERLDRPDLESRFARLKSNTFHSIAPTFAFKYSDHLSATDLNHYMRSSAHSTLIFDFRTRKEYCYSHINFSNILNIEPKVIAELFKEVSSPTDRDLEQRLEKGLNNKELELFRRRHDFELVVMYNLKYGVFSDNKFESLVPLLTDSESAFLPENPFKRLIELLMFRNQFLSTRLKNYPLFLNGGLQRWYQSYGEAALTRASHESFQGSPETNHTSTASIDSSSKYMRTFHDYMSTGSGNSQIVGVPQDNDATNLNVELTDSKSTRRHKRHSALEVAERADQSPAIVHKGSEASSDTLNFCTGLTNLGNSCYMNCILQCLVATPPLSSFLVPSSSSSSGRGLGSYKEHINIENTLGSRGVVTSMFVDLLREMLRNKGKYYAPSKFKKIVGSFSPGKQFATTEQQDCIEFLNFVLDTLHEDLNQRSARSSEERQNIMELSEEQEKVREYLPVRLASTIEWERYLKLNFSIIVDLFQGQYVSQLKCLECQMTSSTYNSFSTLSLPIPEKLGAVTQPMSLFDCLDKFVETELLEEDNKWHCPNCKKFSKSTKKLVISRLPQILIIHFKRFKVQNGHFKKLENFIKYPVNEKLDLTKYWPPIGSYINQSSEVSMSDAKEVELLSRFPDRLQNPPFQYKLYGVANHFGNLTTGHYTSFVKKSSAPNNWCYFDDAKVQHQCSESRVLNQNAYCLFYMRC